MTLENGLQVWVALVRSGLEETRTNRLPGYDAELVRDLREGLYPHATRSLDRELRAAPPSTERFLEVFFRALKPFSGMLRDVLGMFEDASSRRSDENLRIALNFEKASKSLTLTLTEFREAEAFFRRVVRPVLVRRWTANTLFALNQDVSEVLEEFGVPEVRQQFGTPPSLRNPRVREWIEENGKPEWLSFPGFPRSGNTEVDKALEMAEGLIDYMITEVRKLGTSYREFERRLSELQREEPDTNEAEEIDAAEDERPRPSALLAAHDFWPNSFAQHLCITIEALNADTGEKKQEWAARLIEAIRTGFDRPPRYERTRISLEQDFRDLVNLPIWKKRHELYAVWVASQIADALRDLSWEWHPDGDTLHFPFAGIELATLRTSDGAAHVFWTEKRTPLVGGGLLGRRHIQPDYRIMTLPTHRDNATSLVVECKQYRKWSMRNFGAALDDYAKGCPTAPVVLVNYGPTDPGILELVDASRRERTFLLGDFKPGGDAALERFRDIVRGAYTTVLPSHITGATTLELRWGPQFRDLDLHLFIRPTAAASPPPQHIGYGSTRGTVVESPWAEWPEDITRSPPGVECISIARWLAADYDILVHDYSSTPGFPQGDVSVRLIQRDGTEVLFTPKDGTGRWWHVCRIHGGSHRLEEINTIQAKCPYAIG